VSGADVIEPDAPEPIEQGEIETLEAELRAALQQQRAAVERVQETQAEVEALIRRARELLEGGDSRPR
jgi:acyl-CoA reductase-like NAD-dependent aldehyde dehydrogenase